MSKTLKLIAINFGVFAIILGFAEIFFRAFESLTQDTKYQSQDQIEAAAQGVVCTPPPIITDQGELSRYSRDFSCAGVTISQGLRLTAFQPKSPSRILHVFGGSTVFGTGAKDQETIPSYLQELINSEGINIAVKNHGFMTLVASQQSAALRAAEVKEGDIVLFYDGGNDAFNSFVYKSPGGTIIGYNQKNRLAFALVELRSFLQNNSALYRALGVLKAFISGKNDPSNAKCGVIPSASEKSKYISHYLKVISEAKDYSESKGAYFYHVLQPILGSSNGLSPSDQASVQALLDVDRISWCTQASLLDYYSEVSDSYSEKINDFSGLNLSNIFSGSRIPFDDRFIDWIHMTPEANKMMANYLYKHIVRGLNQKY